MYELFQSQLDYMHGLCGVAYLLAALIARALRKSDDRLLPWRWFAWFGVLHSAYEWLKMALVSLPSAIAADYLGLFLLVGSYLCLIEFARSYLQRPRGWIVHLPLVAVWAGLGVPAGIRGWMLSAHSLLGLAGGLGATAVFWKAAVRMPEGRNRKSFHVLGLAVFLQALATISGAFVERYLVPPGALLAAWAIGLRALRGAALLAFILALWKHYGACRDQRIANFAAAARSLDKLILAGLALILLVGWLLTHVAGLRKGNELRAEILNRTKIAGATIDSALVRQLQWGDADLGQPYYEALKTLMMSIREANADLRFASLMGIREGKSYVLVDSEPPDSEDYSPPGQYYEEADPEYNRLLDARVPFVIGPLYDRWGV
jgi:hypothetical protein